MTTPFVRIVEPGVNFSWALEDLAEAEFREALYQIKRNSVPEDFPGGDQLFGEIQVLETWIRTLKAEHDAFLERTAGLDQERARISEEIAEVRRREGWDPGAMKLRLQLEESLHRLNQDFFKLGESHRRAQTEAMKCLLEAYGSVCDQFSSLEVPTVNSLVAFLANDPPKRVLVVHDPEPVERALPPRTP